MYLDTSFQKDRGDLPLQVDDVISIQSPLNKPASESWLKQLKPSK